MSYTVHDVIEPHRCALRTRGLTRFLPPLDDLESLLGGNLILSDQSARFLAWLIRSDTSYSGVSALLTDIAANSRAPGHHRRRPAASRGRAPTLS